MPPVVQDPSFEIAPPNPSPWVVVPDDCDNNGVVYTTSNPHSGVRCVALNSRVFLGATTCSHIYQSVSGFQIGKAYQFAIWKRTVGSFQRDCILYAVNGQTFETQTVGTISGLVGAWTQHVFQPFVAFCDPMDMHFIQGPGSSNQNFQRFIDDFTIVPFIDAEKGIPQNRPTRGVPRGQGPQAGFQSMGPRGILTPQGLSATLIPLFTKGNPSKPKG